MGIRSLVLLSFVVTAFSLASSARADVPPGTGGSTSATGSGTGGAATDPNCSIAVEMTAGSTCQLCSTGMGSAPAGTPACSSLDATYFEACAQSAALQVWCNGPQRLAPSDENVAKCSVSAAGGSWSHLWAAGALAAAAALGMRRRRRS
jgi:MYXO-CTERM domain-containing protein